MNIKGIVLAGGKSLRFGDDKALARYGDHALIEHSASVLKELSLDPVILTNSDRDYSFLNCRIEYDIFPHLGPLGGLYTACKLFPKSVLLMITCDMPALQSATLRTLLLLHRQYDQIAVFALRPGQYQPFPGIYPASLVDLARTFLLQKQFSMQRFLESCPNTVEFPPPNIPDGAKECESRSNTQHGAEITIGGRVEYSFREFSNVNTKADLESLSPQLVSRT